MSQIKSFDQETFIETECSLSIGGKEYQHNGAFVMRNSKTGRLYGVLYAYPNENQVGTWDGSTKIPAKFVNTWQSNFGDIRQTVYFDWHSKQCQGVYFMNSDVVRFKEVSKK